MPASAIGLSVREAHATSTPPRALLPPHGSHRATPLDGEREESAHAPGHAAPHPTLRLLAHIALPALAPPACGARSAQREGQRMDVTRKPRGLAELGMSVEQMAAATAHKVFEAMPLVAGEEPVGLSLEQLCDWLATWGGEDGSS